MTPGEQKIYDALMEQNTKVTLALERINHVEKQTNENAEQIESYKADRNKAIGVMWLGGLFAAGGFFAGIGSMIMSIFSHNPPPHP